MIARPDRDLLRGAIDMHAHTHPALFKRPLDDADLAEIRADYGMRGFVLKDHDSRTVGRAYYVTRLVPETRAVRRDRAEPLGRRHQPARRPGGHPLRRQGRLDAEQPLPMAQGILRHPRLSAARPPQEAARGDGRHGARRGRPAGPGGADHRRPRRRGGRLPGDRATCVSRGPPAPQAAASAPASENSS